MPSLKILKAHSSCVLLGHRLEVSPWSEPGPFPWRPCGGACPGLAAEEQLFSQPLRGSRKVGVAWGAASPAKKQVTPHPHRFSQLWPPNSPLIQQGEWWATGILKRLQNSQAKNKNSVTIYLPCCCSKPVWLSFLWNAKVENLMDIHNTFSFFGAQYAFVI